MKNTLELDHPLLINGKTYTELDYDAEEISAPLFAEADARRLLATTARAAGTKMGNNVSAELDYTFHMYLGFAAVVAVNPEIDMSDLDRAKGDDVRQLMAIGRNFMLGRSATSASADAESENTSETTPEPTTSLQPSSKESL